MLLHVGDSEEKDLHGANKAGLKGVLVERNGEINSNLRHESRACGAFFPFWTT